MEKKNNCFANLIGWANHYDTDEIGALDPELNESLTKEYYNEKHSALRLDFISQSLPQNRDLSEYLKTSVSAAIDSMLNDFTVLNKIDFKKGGFFVKEKLINGSGWINNLIINEGRFVGVSVSFKNKAAIKISVDSIGLQLSSGDQDFNIYVFHSSERDPIGTFAFNNNKSGVFSYIEDGISDLINSNKYNGGDFFIGYFQDDIKGNAIKYDQLNFNTGYCGYCDGGVKNGIFKKIKDYSDCFPFYIPSGPEILENGFDPENVIYINDKNNFGINISFDIRCDLDLFYCQNKFSFKNLLYLSVAYKILRDIIYSPEINNIDENLRIAIIRDLEGDPETNYISMQQQYKNELEGLKVEFMSASKECLSCYQNKTYKAV